MNANLHKTIKSTGRQDYRPYFLEDEAFDEFRYLNFHHSLNGIAPNDFSNRRPQENSPENFEPSASVAIDDFANIRQISCLNRCEGQLLVTDVGEIAAGITFLILGQVTSPNHPTTRKS